MDVERAAGPQGASLFPVLGCGQHLCRVMVELVLGGVLEEKGPPDQHYRLCKRSRSQVLRRHVCWDGRAGWPAKAVSSDATGGPASELIEGIGGWPRSLEDN